MADLTFLLDTNIVSEPVRPQPNAKVLRKLKQYQFRIAIASTTWHELMFGLYRMQDGARRRELSHYLQHGVAMEIPILTYDEPAAHWHALERARLASAGKTAPYIDGEIASIAASNSLILVTRNTAGFRFYSNLQVDNWFAD